MLQAVQRKDIDKGFFFSSEVVMKHRRLGLEQENQEKFITSFVFINFNFFSKYTLKVLFLGKSSSHKGRY